MTAGLSWSWSAVGASCAGTAAGKAGAGLQVLEDAGTAAGEAEAGLQLLLEDAVRRPRVISKDFLKLALKRAVEDGETF